MFTQEEKNVFNDSVKDFLYKHQDYLCYLKDRWTEEKEYEQFSEYEKAIKERLKDYNVKKVLKVGVVFIVENIEITVKVNSSSIKTSALKIA